LANSTTQREDYNQARALLDQVSKDLRRFGVDMPDHDKLSSATVIDWPTTLLDTTLELADDPDLAFESDYEAPPPSATPRGKRRHRGPVSVKAKSKEHIVDEDGDLEKGDAAEKKGRTEDNAGDASTGGQRGSVKKRKVPPTDVAKPSKKRNKTIKGRGKTGQVAGELDDGEGESGEQEEVEAKTVRRTGRLGTGGNQ
jgi:hypothetical protein